MTTQTAFDKFQIKVNNNSETGKIAVDRGRFVLLFNEAQNRLIEYILDKKSEDDIRYIEAILVQQFKLTLFKSDKDYQDFSLPKDYFDFSSLHATADKGKCSDKKMTLFEIKDDDSSLILEDEYNNPSFLAREAPFSIASNKIKIYKDETFQYNKVFLNYYRYPVQIKLVNDADPESEFVENLNPEFDDKFVDRIISVASGEFELNNENQKAQFDIQMAKQKV